MTVQIGPDVVINDSLFLQNIAGAQGRHDNFASKVHTLVDGTLDFSNGVIQKMDMSSDVTFTIPGTVPNVASILLLLDTSATPHTPTFADTGQLSFSWAGGSEPTWSDFRFWQVYIQATLVSGVVRVSAQGFAAAAAPPPTETVSLTGTLALPNNAIGQSDGDVAGIVVGWAFYADGNIVTTTTDATAPPTSARGAWCSNSPPNNTYYMRITDSTGDNIDTSISSPINTWNQMNSSLLVKWSIDYQTASIGQVKIEISDASDGSNILDTGYYGINVESGQ